MRVYSHWLLYYQGQNRKYKKQTGYLQYEFPQPFIYLLYNDLIFIHHYFKKILQ